MICEAIFEVICEVAGCEVIYEVFSEVINEMICVVTCDVI